MDKWVFMALFVLQTAGGNICFSQSLLPLEKEIKYKLLN